MVLGSLFTQFATRNVAKKPQFNSIVSPLLGGERYRATLMPIKKRFMNEFFYASPELTGVVNMVAGDIVEQDYFEPIKKSDTGRNKIRAAELFRDDVMMRRLDFSVIVDTIVTGEGYGYLDKISKANIEKAIETNLREKNIPVTKEMKELAIQANFSDEDLIRPKKYNYVASSTMTNLFDETSIKGYKQIVGTTEVFFRPEEIIHYVFYDVDGRPEGFTPVRTILLHLDLLRFMWKNSEALAKNGGQPDRVFSVEDVDFSGPAYRRIEQELQKYYEVENRHGSLLLNGKVTVQDLVQLDTMQFKELGLYVTGLIALQWRLPRSRIPYIVSNANTKEDTGGNSEKTYWKNIEMFQDMYLMVQNQQLWMPFFGVKRKFKKAYKHDELVEAQVQQTRLNNLTFINNELQRNEKRLSAEYVIRYVNGINEEIEEDDLEEAPNMMEDNSQFRQGLQSNSNLTDSQDKKNKNNKKKQEQDKVSESRGKPTGAGKEDIKSVLEKKERQRVSYNTFIKLYNEDKNMNAEPPRVFISEKDGITRMTYRSTDFVYETMAPSSEVSKASFMNFKKLNIVAEEEILDALDNVEKEE